MELNAKFICATIFTLGLAITGSTYADTASAGELKLKKRTTGSAGSSAIGGFTTKFNANCASGFSKAGEQKSNGNKFTDWFVCTTPVIVCPKQIDKNGNWADISPQAIVQQIGGNPDGGDVKFRVQYKCSYTPKYIPQG